MTQIRANYSTRLHSGVCAVGHQRTPQSRLLSAKTATKEKGSERTLGIGGAEFLEHLGDAHKRRLANTAAGVLPLPPHPSVLPDGLVWCGAHSLALAAPRRVGGRFVDAALWRCTEGKPRATRRRCVAVQQPAQEVWMDGHG
jgi:hypothetical protein